MPELAIDVSHWSGEISKAKFSAAKAGGVSRVVVSLNNLDLARRQLEAAASAGLEVQAYIYLYFAQDVAARVRSCLGVIGGLGVEHVWLDCEDEKHTLTPHQLNARIEDAILAVGPPYTAGIYTAAWWWKKHMGILAGQTRLPLWDAFWDGEADLDAPRYGGWTRAAMSQYRADTTFAGIWCDLNAYEKPVAAAQPVSGLSPSVELTEAYALVTDAFVPAYGPDKTTWRSLPMEGGRRRYLVEVEDR
jgi:GH25 family lysozyme M1 (1,4-beta-N-acetylmuramidase)